MAVEEKRAWIMAVVAVAGYASYLLLVLGRWDGGPLAEVRYADALLWTVGAAIVAGIALNVLVAVTGERGSTLRDQRDREIERFGDHVGNAFVVIGAIAALLMALGGLAHFWIANAIHLGFVLSAVLGSLARIGAYRTGFQPW
ncbi:hypothetical protein [Allokutzneria sp. NRRL B-24872]|uniref:hypothetical protein n=1 Tax=Allokutzneria sp. NRRL B-24872 TaxID=1137961 RepID=UPI001FED4FC1|nr:hypothetical protein [Allokutzneria sp. NRRL B-24872]